MDIYTLRIAASTWQPTVRPEGPDQRRALSRPHSRLAAVARTPPLSGFRPAELTVGVLARASDRDEVLRLALPLRHLVREIVVLFDAERPPANWPRGIRCLTHPLDGDFAAARNRLQAEARTGWVLQLDTDEALAPGAIARLARQASAAGVQGVRSIGLPRRNLVDGQPSDLWPDVQYRLNRHEVRYAGRVHERPDPGGAWRLGTIALGDPIPHRLDRARVIERSRRYEAFMRGGGPAEAAALLTAFVA